MKKYVVIWDDPADRSGHEYFDDENEARAWCERESKKGKYCLLTNLLTQYRPNFKGFNIEVEVTNYN